MTWTTEKPSKPGWYWWRDLSALEATASCMVVYVYEGIGDKFGPMLFVQRDGSYGDIRPVRDVKGEWQGPIEAEEVP